MWMQDPRWGNAKLVRLEELWVSDNCKLHAGWKSLIEVSPNIRKFVAKSWHYDDSLNDFGLRCWFQKGKHNCTQYQFIVEKIEITQTKPSNVCPNGISQRAWQMLIDCDMPCGTKGSSQIQCNIQNIKFVDLNFDPVLLHCTSDHSEAYSYSEAALEALFSDACIFLKRLRLRTCLFSLKGFEKLELSQEPRIKKIRTQVDHPFHQIALKLYFLKELEIRYCRDCATHWSIDGGYNSIAMLVNLEKISLDIPPLSDGSFLETTLKTCKNLRFLSLNCLRLNYEFVNNLRNLKYATSLKDFRLLYDQIDIDMLFDCINDINKLQRMFLSCNKLCYACDNNESAVYKKFFQKHPNLIFLFIAARKQTCQQNSET
ncbi:unnamed protein product [Acanthoscelides obtectus]|nr:unnamed protein product [Acanthoscelides obtectus]CAK1676971.1 hypothetical protein AOBTE_LOCUS31038 [Acanthoscelides obtectus]